MDYLDQLLSMNAEGAIVINGRYAGVGIGYAPYEELVSRGRRVVLVNAVGALLLHAGAHKSLNVRGLFPAGEGAGYAGGILSAGVDGIRTAEAVARAIMAGAA